MDGLGLYLGTSRIADVILESDQERFARHARARSAGIIEPVGLRTRIVRLLFGLPPLRASGPWPAGT